MARRRTTADRARHAAEQRRHRQRLEDGLVRGPGQGESATPCGRIPETRSLDIAVVAAVYDLLRNMQADSPETAPRARRRFLERAADALASQGYDRDRSLALLRRRLLAPSDRFDAWLGREDGAWDYLTP